MEKVWLAQYQQGVPQEINPYAYESLVAMLEEACDLHHDKTAFINLGSTLSFGDLETKSRQFALFLRQLGLKRGARIAIMMPNLLQYPVAMLGALRGGFVVVNTNPLYTAFELIHQLNDSGAEVIVVLANFASTVEKALPSLRVSPKVIITEIGDFFPYFKRFVVNNVVKYIKKMVPPYKIRKAIALNEALKIGGNEPLASANLRSQDLAFLQYTGGTTGISKGAMLTHGNMVANVLQAEAWIKPLINDKDIVVTALPLYHIFSLTANCLIFIKYGLKNIFITNPRDISAFIHEIKNSQFSIITGVNTLFNALLAHPKFKEVDFSKLKTALSGGVVLHKSVADKWRDLTGISILEAYGLTEACPAVTINPLTIKEFNGSVGVPLPSTEISVRGLNDQEVGFDEPGELCVKGPQIMAGYWQKPDETTNVMTTDGFLKTGDIVTVNEKGFVTIVERKKDLIIVSGFNVYPTEVERVISMHPGVLEVGVVGFMTEDGGERVKACVVKRDPGLTEEELIQFCREHLTAYKVPKVIEFYPELPKTNIGKILRRALKEPVKK